MTPEFKIDATPGDDFLKFDSQTSEIEFFVENRKVAKILGEEEAKIFTDYLATAIRKAVEEATGWERKLCLSQIEGIKDHPVAANLLLDTGEHGQSISGSDLLELACEKIRARGEKETGA